MKGEFKDMEDNVAEFSKMVVKLTTNWNNKKETLEEHINSTQQLQKQLNALNTEIKTKTKQVYAYSRYRR